MPPKKSKTERRIARWPMAEETGEWSKVDRLIAALIRSGEVLVAKDGDDILIHRESLERALDRLTSAYPSLEEALDQLTSAYED